MYIHLYIHVDVYKTVLNTDKIKNLHCIVRIYTCTCEAECRPVSLREQRAEVSVEDPGQHVAAPVGQVHRGGAQTRLPISEAVRPHEV